MHRKLWMAGLLAVLLLALLAPVVYANGLADDKVIVGENYVLHSGERQDGNLAVIGGNATLERDSTVTGDVAVMGGALMVAGTVRGSVAAFGGAVTLADSAVIEGDLAAFGGSVQRAPGAVVRGDVFGPRFPEIRVLPRAPELPQAPNAFGFVGSLFRWQMWTLGWSLSLILLGVVALLVAPRAMGLIASTLATDPAVSFGVGLLTLIVALLGGALLIIACGLGLLVWLLAAFAFLVGWLAMGLWVGQRLLRALRVQDASSLAEVALGVFLITVLARLPWCIGFLITVIIGSVGLGAVVLTRFGTQSPSVGARPTTGGGPIAPAPTEPPQPAAVELPAPMVPPAEPALPEPVVSEAPRVEVIEGSPEPEARQRA